MQTGQVERPGDPVDLVRRDPQLLHQQVEHLGRDRVLDLQPHRRPEAPPEQLLLQGLHEVLRDVLVNVEVLVARDAEDVVLDDLHALEELAEMGGDHILKRDEPILGRRHEPRQLGGNLHSGEHRVIGRRVPHHDGQIQAQSRNIRKRVCRVDRQRRQHGPDALPEQFAQLRTLFPAQIGPSDDVDALARQLRADPIVEHGRVPPGQFLRDRRDPGQLLAGLQPALGTQEQAGGHPPFETRHPHPEELVEIAGEDRQETHPFKKGSEPSSASSSTRSLNWSQLSSRLRKRSCGRGRSFPWCRSSADIWAICPVLLNGTLTSAQRLTLAGPSAPVSPPARPAWPPAGAACPRAPWPFPLP